ncbi:MAG: hypothetical protein WCL50_06580 [Spirochaetota bacterium]
MKRFGNILVRLIFLAETGLLPYLGLALALASYGAGDAIAEWSLFGSLGLASLVVCLWVALRADPSTTAGKVLYVLVDVLALAASGFWIWLTQGTLWLAQFAWGLLSFGFALASLGLVLAPGSGERLGLGLLRRVMVESRRETRWAHGARGRLFLDLSALLLVLVLAGNAVFAWGGYGQPGAAPASRGEPSAPASEEGPGVMVPEAPAIGRLAGILAPLGDGAEGEAEKLVEGPPFLRENMARLLDALRF